MPIWTIYCHIHTESGRRYIGLTSQTMAQRWKTHVSHAKISKGGRWHFPNAIRKYGKDAFSHEALAQSRTLEDANATEEAIISQYDTRNPAKGFNLAKGGTHVPHPIRKNPWKDPEYRARVIPTLIAVTQTAQARANNKASLNTPESKAKRSRISKEIQSRSEVKAKIASANKGRILSPETLRKIAAANRSRDLPVRKRISDAGAIATSRKWNQLSKQPVSHKVCEKHGVVSISDCYVRIRVSGRKYLICKMCSKRL